jgi:two-component system KDP operon response regulator KdpE
MSQSAKVLVIDDEQAIRRFLKISLENEGYAVLEAAGGKEGLSMAATHQPQMIILDLSLPDLDGIQVLRQLREWTTVPIIILTVRDAEQVKVSLLDAGADDYLTKPFSVPELLARIRVALRHTFPDDKSPVFKSDELEIDFVNRTVKNRSKEVKLTVIEFNLLALLARHAGKLVTQRHILKEIWGPGAVEHSHYLRVYIRQLRKKLEKKPAHPELIITEPSIGYRLNV